MGADALYEHVRDTLAGLGLQDQEIQHELARWVELLETSGRDLRVDNKSKEQVLARLVRQAGAANSAFLSDSPEVVFAPTLRVEAENKLLRHNGWFKRNLIRLTDGSPALTVCLGAFGAVAAGLLTLILQLTAFTIDMGAHSLRSRRFLGDRWSSVSR
jgi:hypothetical protein